MRRETNSSRRFSGVTPGTGGIVISLEIGDRSFTRYRNSYDKDPNRHFYLKDCPKLKSLKMGRFSFSDYSVIEIENVDALESIVMGDLEKESDNFAYAPLELKSILIHNE